jgi:hypothetical protein
MKHRSLIILLALLSGCGGGGYGGSSGGGGMNLSSAPGETALVAYQQASHQNTLNASSSGNSFSLQVSSVPNSGTTTFNGSSPAYSTTDTVTLSENGTLIATNISTSYFLLNPFVPLGKVSSTGTPYAVVASSSPLPTTLTVGGSGAVDTLTYYHDSTKSTIDADETVTYSVMANNSTTLIVCLNSTISGVTTQGMADGLANDSESDCYTVDAAGNVALTSITVMVNGTTLTFM